MLKHLAGYGASLLALLIIDGLWLGVVAKNVYQQAMGHWMAEQPYWPAAIAFYLLYPLGVLLFAVAPLAADTPPAFGRTLLLGALFGLFAYGTYDLTNLAVLKGWPAGLSLIDMAWGTALSAVVAGVGRWAFDWVA